MPSSLASRLLTFTLSSLIVFSFFIFLADLFSGVALVEVSAMSGSRFEDFLLEFDTAATVPFPIHLR